MSERERGLLYPDQELDDGRHRQNEESSRERGTDKDKKSTAEWVTLGISLSILLFVVGLVLYVYMTQNDDPVVINVQPRLDELRQAGGIYYLPVEVTNEGGQTAGAVTVQAMLTSDDGSTETVSFTIDFLAGGANQRVVTAFRKDPAKGEINTVFSFTEP